MTRRRREPLQTVQTVNLKFVGQGFNRGCISTTGDCTNGVPTRCRAGSGGRHVGEEFGAWLSAPNVDVLSGGQ